MAYLNTSIKDLIEEKICRNTFLPAIQREYVWSPYQIEKLFDSIMCGYPISSFLFWRIREEDKKKWIAYEFLKDFDKEHPHNKEANMNGVNQDIFLVLDGQQRATSLNIGLKGSYRFFYRKWRTTRLYLDLLKGEMKDSPEDLTYGFLFRENDNPDSKSQERQYWYLVGDILNYEDSEDAKDSVRKQLVLGGYSEDEIGRALRIIGKLYDRICNGGIINYFEEKTNDYDKVLEIFVRTNTGGVKLEYSDILLSTATAKWRDLNAREEINNFTDEINKIGAGYNFGKDFVMKGAMYLTEDLPIQYKLSSFTQDNLEKIEDHWDETKTAIRDTVNLVKSFGFFEKNLVSKLALLPIAQYLRNKKDSKYLSSDVETVVNEQNNIQKWLTLMILRNALGAATDGTLNNFRKVINENGSFFPYQELFLKLGMDEHLNDAEIENWLSCTYSTRYSFLILSLLYPNRDWKGEVFNEDHIFPKSMFEVKKLRALGYDQLRIEQYQRYYNTIVNLELINETENKSKNATSFDEWIRNKDSAFKKRHFIPEMDNYDFDHFLDFAEARKNLLMDFLRNLSF